MGRTYRIFCSRASEDHEACLRLEKQLFPLVKQGTVRFWHEGQLTGGDNRERKIDQEFFDADVILVLISAEAIFSDACSRQMERAAQRQKDGIARVVPVLLRDVDWKETALGALEPLPKDGKFIGDGAGKDAAWLAVANGIKDLLKVLDQEPVFGTRPTYRRVITEAFRLDRIKQWERIKQRCTGSDHTFFLLYGKRGQAVKLFADRVFRLVQEARQAHHLVLEVSIRKGVYNASDLENNLREALTAALHRPSDIASTTAGLIHHITRRQPLFLVLGPAAQNERTWPDKERQCLREFVTDRLPHLLPADGHRVQALLMLEYQDPQASLHAWVDGWAQALGTRYCKLDEATLPDWQEIEGILKEKNANSDIILAVKGFYDDLHTQKYPSFEDLAEELDRHLE